MSTSPQLTPTSPISPPDPPSTINTPSTNTNDDFTSTPNPSTPTSSTHSRKPKTIDTSPFCAQGKKGKYVFLAVAPTDHESLNLCKQMNISHLYCIDFTHLGPLTVEQIESMEDEYIAFQEQKHLLQLQSTTTNLSPITEHINQQQQAASSSLELELPTDITTTTTTQPNPKQSISLNTNIQGLQLAPDPDALPSPVTVASKLTLQALFNEGDDMKLNIEAYNIASLPLITALDGIAFLFLSMSNQGFDWGMNSKRIQYELDCEAFDSLSKYPSVNKAHTTSIWLIQKRIYHLIREAQLPLGGISLTALIDHFGEISIESDLLLVHMTDLMDLLDHFQNQTYGEFMQYYHSNSKHAKHIDRVLQHALNKLYSIRSNIRIGDVLTNRKIGHLYDVVVCEQNRTILHPQSFPPLPDINNPTKFINQTSLFPILTKREIVSNYFYTLKGERLAIKDVEKLLEKYICLYSSVGHYYIRPKPNYYPNQYEYHINQQQTDDIHQPQKIFFERRNSQDSIEPLSSELIQPSHSFNLHHTQTKIGKKLHVDPQTAPSSPIFTSQKSTTLNTTHIPSAMNMYDDNNNGNDADDDNSDYDEDIYDDEDDDDNQDEEIEMNNNSQQPASKPLKRSKNTKSRRDPRTKRNKNHHRKRSQSRVKQQQQPSPPQQQEQQPQQQPQQQQSNRHSKSGATTPITTPISKHHHQSPFGPKIFSEQQTRQRSSSDVGHIDGNAHFEDDDNDGVNLLDVLGMTPDQSIIFNNETKNKNVQTSSNTNPIHQVEIVYDPIEMLNDGSDNSDEKVDDFRLDNSKIDSKPIITTSPALVHIDPTQSTVGQNKIKGENTKKSNDDKQQSKSTKQQSQSQQSKSTNQQPQHKQQQQQQPISTTQSTTSTPKSKSKSNQRYINHPLGDPTCTNIDTIFAPSSSPLSVPMTKSPSISTTPQLRPRNNNQSVTTTPSRRNSAISTTSSQHTINGYNQGRSYKPSSHMVTTPQFDDNLDDFKLDVGTNDNGKQNQHHPNIDSTTTTATTTMTKNGNGNGNNNIFYHGLPPPPLNQSQHSKSHVKETKPISSMNILSSSSSTMGDKKIQSQNNSPILQSLSNLSTSSKPIGQSKLIHNDNNKNNANSTSTTITTPTLINTIQHIDLDYPQLPLPLDIDDDNIDDDDDDDDSSLDDESFLRRASQFINTGNNNNNNYDTLSQGGYNSNYGGSSVNSPTLSANNSPYFNGTNSPRLRYKNQDLTSFGIGLPGGPPQSQIVPNYKQLYVSFVLKTQFDSITEMDPELISDVLPTIKRHDNSNIINNCQ